MPEQLPFISRYRSSLVRVGGANMAYLKIVQRVDRPASDPRNALPDLLPGGTAGVEFMRGRGRTIEATLQGLCEFWFGLINIFMINAPAVATFVPCFLLLGSILAFTLVTLGLTLAMPTACQVLPLAATFIDPS